MEPVDDARDHLRWNVGGRYVAHRATDTPDSGSEYADLVGRANADNTLRLESFDDLVSAIVVAAEPIDRATLSALGDHRGDIMSVEGAAGPSG